MGEEKRDNEYSFVKETILEPKKGFGYTLKNLMVILVSAVIFGIVACVIFVVFRPKLEKLINGSGETNVPTITTDATTEESSNDKENVTTGEQETNEGESTDKIYSAEDLKELYGMLSVISDKIRPSLVTISAYDGEQEIFTAPENEVISSGVIVKKDSDIYIVTMYDNLKELEYIRVTFADGTKAFAELFERDYVTGLAVILVEAGNVSDSTREILSVATFSETVGVAAKEPIIYVGNPFDKSLYETLGFVANELSSVTGLDIEYRMVNTDIFITSCANGFMFNLEGEMVGVVTDYGNNNQTVKGILVSDVNYIIQRMLVDAKILYLGIYGEAITDEIREISGINMPDGVYVTNVDKDSPAYLAGIREGDIIAKIGHDRISTMLDIKRCLQIRKINDKLNVVVHRYEGNKYSDYTISVTVGEREYAY